MGAISRNGGIRDGERIVAIDAAAVTCRRIVRNLTGVNRHRASARETPTPVVAPACPGAVAANRGAGDRDVAGEVVEPAAPLAAGRVATDHRVSDRGGAMDAEPPAVGRGRVVCDHGIGDRERAAGLTEDASGADAGVVVRNGNIINHKRSRVSNGTVARAVHTGNRHAGERRIPAAHHLENTEVAIVGCDRQRPSTRTRDRERTGGGRGCDRRQSRAQGYGADCTEGDGIIRSSSVSI